MHILTYLIIIAIYPVEVKYLDTVNVYKNKTKKGCISSKLTKLRFRQLREPVLIFGIFRPAGTRGLLFYQYHKNHLIFE